MNDFEEAKVFTEDNVMESVTQNKTDSVAVVARGNEDLAVIDSMVATAQRYPRIVKESLNELKTIALASRKVAESCFYKLPRGGKIIKGKSVRLAEMAQYCWGHVYAGARPVSVERDVVVAEGSAFDCQRNIRSSVTIRRSILGKGGKRYNADMINTTMLAARSIAKREAIYDIIPAALLEDIYEEAIKIAVGDIKTLPERRTEGLNAFSKMGITTEQLLDFLGVTTIEEIGLEEFETMLGVYQGIISKDLSIDEIFPPAQKPVKVSGDTDTLKPDAKKRKPTEEGTRKPDKEPESETDNAGEKSDALPLEGIIPAAEEETKPDPVLKFMEPIKKPIPVEKKEAETEVTVDDDDPFADI